MPRHRSSAAAAARLPTLLLAALFWTSLAAQEPAATASSYDPLRVDAAAEVVAVPLTARDEARERDIPIEVYLPAATAPAPVVLFSHGLGGSRDTSPYLGEHWARRGYVAVFLQHPGSDVDVWRDAPLGERMAKLRAAANGRNLRDRCLDVGAVLDRLTAWNTDAASPLAGRLDVEHVGMSGHSFGAMTTQMVTGQSTPLVGQPWLDPRIDAALPMSPSSPRRGDLARAFGAVAIPWLCMTGTRDTAPIGDQDPESRRKVFANLPVTIDRFELVLHDAEHAAFVGGEGRALIAKRNPNHHRAILALSTAFWDACLRGDAAARAWLFGDGAKGVLEPDDVWQCVGAARAEQPPK